MTAPQVSREDLAAMTPSERLEAVRTGRAEDVLRAGDRGRNRRIVELLGVDAQALSTMTPAAILSAAKATHQAEQAA